MKKKKPLSKDQILAHMLDLASHPLNDAVCLAFLPQDALQNIAGLHLIGLSEFKRNQNGSVELKFIDRLAVLKAILEQLDGTDDGALAFLHALEGEANEDLVSRR